MDPSESHYWRERGEALHRLKRYDEALISLDHAVGPDLRNGGAWRLRSSVLSYLKRHEEALDTAEHAIASVGASNAWSLKMQALREPGREDNVRITMVNYRKVCDAESRARRVTG
jgi:tetratricopeptide (TPR) repeat protein